MKLYTYLKNKGNKILTHESNRLIFQHAEADDFYAQVEAEGKKETKNETTERQNDQAEADANLAKVAYHQTVGDAFARMIELQTSDNPKARALGNELEAKVFKKKLDEPVLEASVLTQKTTELQNLLEDFSPENLAKNKNLPPERNPLQMDLN